MRVMVSYTDDAGRSRKAWVDADFAQTLTPNLTRAARHAAIRDHIKARDPAAHATDVAWPHAFRIGQQVRLNSGGHRMTVVGLRCSQATCADPYAGALEQVSVIWSRSSQLDGDDVAEMDFHPDVITDAMLLPHEEIPF